MGSTKDEELEASLLIHSSAFDDFLQNSKEIESDRRASSSRTKKAREKLLKLSSVQFAELSTDVYDELRRRQDQNSETPKYLLPNQQFHPKRNQARQKLASLPPTRFKDLVTDMLYETERRGHELRKKNDVQNDHSTAHIGIQAGTVIPTKSTLAWSSDEEDDGNEGHEEKTLVSRPETDDHALKDIENSIIKLHHKSMSLSSNDYNEETQRYPESISSPPSKNRNRRISSNVYGSPRVSHDANGHHHTNSTSKDREIELLLAEGNKMDKTITIHEQTIKDLKEQIQQLENDKQQLHGTTEEHLSKLASYEQELASHKDTILLLQNQTSSRDAETDTQVADLQQEISKLNFTIKNLEREKHSNETVYLELRDKHEKVDQEHKQILDDYKVLQEKYNLALLAEDELKEGSGEERKKHLARIQQLEAENSQLMAEATSLRNEVNKSRSEGNQVFAQQMQSVEEEKAALEAELMSVKDQLEAEKLKKAVPIISDKALESNLTSRESVSELGKIKGRLQKVNSKEVNDNDETIEGLKLQILDWQKKYQDLRSELLKQSITTGVESHNTAVTPVDLSEKALQEYIDPAGLVSLKSVVDLNSLISSFLLVINDDNFSTDLLFETITKITIIAGNIASEGETIQNGEYSALIKASVSHAITSTRFYAVHGKALPKLVVETAVSEISFSVCNLVAAAKANRTAPNSTILFNDISSRDYNSPSFANSNNNQSAANTGVTRADENLLNVRPLRMAKKNGQSASPIITTKRENPFTTSFSLSSIGMPNGKSADTMHSNPNTNGARSLPLPPSNSQPKLQPRLQPRSQPRPQPPLPYAHVNNSNTNVSNSSSNNILKDATGNSTKKANVLPYDSKNIIKRSIVSTFDNRSPNMPSENVFRNESAAKSSQSVQNNSLKNDSFLSEENNDTLRIAPAVDGENNDTLRNALAKSDTNNSFSKNDFPINNGSNKDIHHISESTRDSIDFDDVSDGSIYDPDENITDTNDTKAANSSNVASRSIANNSDAVNDAVLNQSNRVNATNNVASNQNNNANVGSDAISNQINYANAVSASEIIQTAPTADEFSLKYSNQLTPKKSSVSSLKAKFTSDSQKDKADITKNPKLQSAAVRNITPTGNILSRVKQLESSSNSGSVNSSPMTSPKSVTKSLSNKLIQQFENSTAPISLAIENADQSINESVDQSIKESVDQSINKNIDQNIKESVDQNIKESVDQNINKNIDQSINKNIDQNINKNIDQNINKNIDQSIKESVDQNINKNIDQSINKNIDQNINKNIDQNINKNIDQSIKESVDQSINKNIDQSINESVDQSINESVDQSIKESVDQSINESVDQSINESVDQSINESVDQSINKNIDQSINKNIDQNIKESVDQSINESVDQSINESVDQSINESVDQSINESVDHISNKNADQSVESIKSNEKKGNASSPSKDINIFKGAAAFTSDNKNAAFEPAKPEPPKEIASVSRPTTPQPRAPATSNNTKKDTFTTPKPNSFQQNVESPRSIKTANAKVNGDSSPRLIKTANGSENANSPKAKDPVLKIQKPNTEVLNNPGNDNSMPSPLQETRKADRSAKFDVNNFDIADPDNTLAELLLYLEHQTVEVISTIQTLLSSIKTPDSTTGTLKEGAKAIGEVVGQMFDATSVSMAQTRNVQLREHGRWVVQSLADCGRRMDMLCSNDKSDDDDYADKHFKQRLAGIAFDIAKCTKELVKTVEEASIKEEIAVIDARLSRGRP